MDDEIRKLERRVLSVERTQDDVERLFVLRERAGCPLRVRWEEPLTTAQAASADSITYHKGRFADLAAYSEAFDGAAIRERAAVVLKIADDAGVPLWTGLCAIILRRLTGSDLVTRVPKKLWAVLFAEMIDRTTRTPSANEWRDFMLNVLYCCGAKIGPRLLLDSKFSHLVPDDLRAASRALQDRPKTGPRPRPSDPASTSEPASP